MTSQKYKGQRINGWYLGCAILFWMCSFSSLMDYYFKPKEYNNVFLVLVLILAIIITKLSFEDIK